MAAGGSAVSALRALLVLAVVLPQAQWPAAQVAFSSDAVVVPLPAAAVPGASSVVAAPPARSAWGRTAAAPAERPLNLTSLLLEFVDLQGMSLRALGEAEAAMRSGATARCSGVTSSASPRLAASSVPRTDRMCIG